MYTARDPAPFVPPLPQTAGPPLGQCFVPGIDIAPSPASPPPRSTPALKSTDLRGEIVRDFARLQALSSSWDQLWNSEPENEVFLTSGWARAWWNAFGAAHELCAPVVRAGNEVVGILPLVIKGRRLQFLGSPESDYADILCLDPHTVAVLTSALQALREEIGWREAVLDALPAHSRIVRHWAALPSRVRKGLHVLPSGRAYTILLANRGGQLLEELARKPHLRRRQNKLEKAGPVEFRHLESSPEALAHLELFFDSQRRRRAVHGKSSAADRPEFRRFLRSLVREFDLQRELRFGVLELDRQPLAWHFSFELNGKFLLYQQTFAVDAWDLAPGEALLRHLLLYAKDRVRREFDFTRGDEPFKQRFSNHETRLFTLYAERHGFAGALRGWGRRAGAILGTRWRHLRSSAKNDKNLFERFRSLRSQLARFASRLSALLRRRKVPLPIVLWRCVWNRAATFVLEGASLPTTRAQPGQTSPENAVCSGTLSDLVDFAQSFPDVLSPTGVLPLRARFRRGDSILCERISGQPVRISWLTTRPIDELLGAPALRDSPSVEPALTLYECLEDSQVTGRIGYQQLLGALQHVAAAKGIKAALLCTEHQKPLQAAAEQRDFRCTHRVSTHRLFGHIVRQAVDSQNCTTGRPHV
jgi:CelD/BcsL family acetyltransferase involved in cellulose biosynthesis